VDEYCKHATAYESNNPTTASDKVDLEATGSHPVISYLSGWFPREESVLQSKENMLSAAHESYLQTKKHAEDVVDELNESLDNAKERLQTQAEKATQIADAARKDVSDADSKIFVQKLQNQTIRASDMESREEKMKLVMAANQKAAEAADKLAEQKFHLLEAGNRLSELDASIARMDQKLENFKETVTQKRKEMQTLQQDADAAFESTNDNQDAQNKALESITAEYEKCEADTKQNILNERQNFKDKNEKDAMQNEEDLKDANFEVHDAIDKAESELFRVRGSNHNLDADFAKFESDIESAKQAIEEGYAENDVANAEAEISSAAASLDLAETERNAEITAAVPPTLIGSAHYRNTNAAIQAHEKKLAQSAAKRESEMANLKKKLNENNVKAAELKLAAEKKLAAELKSQTVELKTEAIDGVSETYDGQYQGNKTEADNSAVTEHKQGISASNVYAEKKLKDIDKQREEQNAKVSEAQKELDAAQASAAELAAGSASDKLSVAFEAGTNPKEATNTFWDGFRDDWKAKFSDDSSYLAEPKPTPKEAETFVTQSTTKLVEQEANLEKMSSDETKLKKEAHQKETQAFASMQTKLDAITKEINSIETKLNTAEKKMKVDPSIMQALKAEETRLKTERENANTQLEKTLNDAGKQADDAEAQANEKLKEANDMIQSFKFMARQLNAKAEVIRTEMMTMKTNTDLETEITLQNVAKIQAETSQKMAISERIKTTIEAMRPVLETCESSKEGSWKEMEKAFRAALEKDEAILNQRILNLEQVMMDAEAAKNNWDAAQKKRRFSKKDARAQRQKEISAKRAAEDAAEKSRAGKAD
jgi:hypothetical protein